MYRNISDYRMTSASSERKKHIYILYNRHVLPRYSHEWAPKAQNNPAEHAGTTQEYEDMLRFAAEKAALPPAVSVNEVAVDEDVLQELAWAQARTNEMIINEREKVIQRIEARAAALVSSGEVERWFNQADQHKRCGERHQRPSMERTSRGNWVHRCRVCGELQTRSASAGADTSSR